MKVYDKIKSMNQTDLARFISDLLCGKYNETTKDLTISFNENLCVNCKAEIIQSDIGVVVCNYSNGNCADVNRVKKRLESEVGKDV